MYFTTSALNFLWGWAVFNFSPKIGLKSTKNVRFCIAYFTSQWGARAPPPAPSLATLLLQGLIYNLILTLRVFVCSSLSAKNNKSSHSTASTTSLKSLNAKIELQTAQLEAEQLNEHLKEQTAKADLETKLHAEMRELEAQVQITEAKRKIELAKKKREVLDEFNENCSVKSGRSVLSKRCKVSSEPVLPLTKDKKVSIGQYYPVGLPKGSVSSSFVSVSIMVSSNMPKVSIGRITERPQSVEKPTRIFLSASAKAYEPTVSMGSNCPLNRPRVAEYPVSSALPLSVTQVPSYEHTVSDARQYVQNSQWAPESRSLPEVTQMTSYQPLYQHQMTTSFEQQTSQVSDPVNSTTN